MRGRYIQRQFTDSIGNCARVSETPLVLAESVLVPRGIQEPSMRAMYSLAAVTGVGLAVAAFAPDAKAGDWSVGIQIGIPGVVVASPPTEYYVPPPRYYVPRPEYVPGYYEPPPVRYYRAPVLVYGGEHGEHWRHHGWHHRHHDDDDED